MREYNFDGLPGLTHNYGALSRGNVASMSHGGERSNPRAAALEGLAKMRFVHALGVGQAVLPPQPRPDVRALRGLGFTGSDEQVIAQAAAHQGGHLLRICASASAMWTANAATCAPSADSGDGRLHLTPANLQAMFHRAIEAATTTRVLRAIFADSRRFVVHEPLPGGGQFADEGAANHTRLVVPGRPPLHLHAWGRSAFAAAGDDASGPRRFPARQTREACEALARLHRLPAESVLFWQQHPDGIDAGAFHTDVLAVGSGSLLLLHELAFREHEALCAELRRRLGDELSIVVATQQELPVADAVSAYPFNSQLLALPGGGMTIVAPEDCREHPAAARFLERVVAEANPVRSLHTIDVRQSMRNGGGPACLRQRILLGDEEVAAVRARVFFDESLDAELSAWIERHYRDRLEPADLADPLLHRENMTALDELTHILRLGPVYDFQV